MNIQALFLEMHNPSSWRLHTDHADGTVPRLPVRRWKDYRNRRRHVTSKVLASPTESCRLSRQARFRHGIGLGHKALVQESQAIFPLPAHLRNSWMHRRRAEHTALDAACGKSVPDRFFGSISRLERFQKHCFRNPQNSNRDAHWKLRPCRELHRTRNRVPPY